MSAGEQIIAREAGDLAAMLPYALVESLAQALGACDSADEPAVRARLLRDLGHPNYRSLVASFFDRWQAGAQAVPPAQVGIALLTAAHVEQVHRRQQAVELVWTGPDVGVVPVRRTEQALLQVIQGAAARLVIVSYAVFQVPRVGQALVEAAGRGVSIAVIVETPNRVEGASAYDTLRALGSAVAACCRVYLWPLEQRQTDASGRPGILHVKCAVADGRTLLLSSANLTEYAFTLNMELGLLVTGGHLPSQVEQHFDRLIETGVLVEVS